MLHNESRKDGSLMNSIPEQLLHIQIFLNEPVCYVRHMVETQPWCPYVLECFGFR